MPYRRAAVGEGAEGVQCGISTACFYPAETLDALERVAALGAPVTELFLNSPGELDDEYVQALAAVQRQSGIRISSVHPCTSAMEGFFFASEYPARLRDGLRFYRRYYEICRLLGATVLVFHGARLPAVEQAFSFPDKAYAANFSALAALGREYGVALCHENVAYCRLAAPRDVEALGPLLGEDAAWVLDVKQVRRRGGDIGAMAAAMGRRIRQVHISDGAPGAVCLPPGRGDFDFAAFFALLQNLGYGGDVIIEVYSDSFTRDGELADAMRYAAARLPG